MYQLSYSNSALSQSWTGAYLCCDGVWGQHKPQGTPGDFSEGSKRKSSQFWQAAGNNTKSTANMLKAFNMSTGSRPDAIHITSFELIFDPTRSSAKKPSSPHLHHQHYHHHTAATNPESSKSLRKEWSPGYQHTTHLQPASKGQAVKTIHPPTDDFLPPLFSCRAFSQGQESGLWEDELF